MIFEDGLQRRHFVHVTDEARACRLGRHVITICSEESSAIQYVAHTLVSARECNNTIQDLSRQGPVA
jgi:hypothetical protein